MYEHFIAYPFNINSSAGFYPLIHASYSRNCCFFPSSVSLAVGSINEALCVEPVTGRTCSLCVKLYGYDCTFIIFGMYTNRTYMQPLDWFAYITFTLKKWRAAGYENYFCENIFKNIVYRMGDVWLCTCLMA